MVASSRPTTWHACAETPFTVLLRVLEPTRVWRLAMKAPAVAIVLKGGDTPALSRTFFSGEGRETEQQIDAQTKERDVLQTGRMFSAPKKWTRQCCGIAVLRKMACSTHISHWLRFVGVDAESFRAPAFFSRSHPHSRPTNKPGRAMPMI